MHILIVEDDFLLGDGLKTVLAQKGLTVDRVEDGESAIAAIQDNQFDLVVLDMKLPRMSGLDVLKKLRGAGNDIPIIVLTAKDTLQDKLEGLDYGADDYLTKPFAVEELSARLYAVHRRRYGRSSIEIKIGDLRVNISGKTVYEGERQVHMSSREIAVLIKLMENTGSIVSRNALEESLYDWDSIIESNAVEVYIHHIRKKLKKNIIKTIRGIGYMIDEKHT